ncbi:hypothetical protein Acsp03_61050 [Actinomadura sp. NBRC 104412]|nr:hypothetical protein Acsp03_61050 [Actinomadura sp. NBRC 104412]
MRRPGMRPRARADAKPGTGKLARMRSGEQREGTGRHRAVAPCSVPPVQSFLFGHSRAEVVYDCR